MRPSRRRSPKPLAPPGCGSCAALGQGAPRQAEGYRGGSPPSRRFVVELVRLSNRRPSSAPGDEIAQRTEVVARAVSADRHDQMLHPGGDERIGVAQQVVVQAPCALDLARIAPDVLAVLEEDLV